jgi:plastocyanin
VAVQPGAIRIAARQTGAVAPAAPAGDIVFTDHGTVDVRRAASATIHADDYYFEPTFVRVAAGQRLRVSILNRAGTLHNLSVPALGVDRDVPPQARADLDLVAPESGSLLFFCKFHGPLGQNGRFLVAGAD